MLPNFLIIGAQKSASSFLQTCLNDHPQIYLPDGETPFFESPDYEKNSIFQLESIFYGRKEKCLGIKRPNYIGKPEVPERIYRHIPNAKLIAVLRNPIERAVSSYYHNINYGFLPPLNIEIGMRKIILEPAFSRKYPRAREVLEFGFYYKHISRYLEHFSNQSLLIFLHDDILKNSTKCIQNAYSFLEVDNHYFPSFINSQPQKVIYNLSRLKFITLRNLLLYNYNPDKSRLFLKKSNIFKEILIKALNGFDHIILERIYPSRKPDLSPQLNNLLINLYIKDLSNLEVLINRDLNHWR